MRRLEPLACSMLASIWASRSRNLHFKYMKKRYRDAFCYASRSKDCVLLPSCTDPVLVRFVFSKSYLPWWWSLSHIVISDRDQSHEMNSDWTIFSCEDNCIDLQLLKGFCPFTADKRIFDGLDMDNTTVTRYTNWYVRKRQMRKWVIRWDELLVTQVSQASL